MALAAKNIPVVANVPNGGVGLIVASSNTVTLGSDTNGVSIYTASSAGGRCMSLTAVTDDTVTVNVFVWILRSSTVIPIGLVNVPLSSGNTNAARFLGTSNFSTVLVIISFHIILHCFKSWP